MYNAGKSKEMQLKKYSRHINIPPIMRNCSCNVKHSPATQSKRAVLIYADSFLNQFRNNINYGLNRFILQ